MYRESTPTPATKTAAATAVWVGYARVSTDRQGQSGLGLEAQVAAMTAAAEARGVDLRVEVELGSGKDLKGRPVLQRVLDELRAGNVAGVMVAKLDRLSRSTLDYATIAAAADREGWKLTVLDLPDAEGPIGGAMAGMMSVFAQLERDLIATRTREAAAAAKARGARLGRRCEDRARSVDLAVEAEALRGEGLTFRAIAEVFNGRGEPTLRGGCEWRPSNIQALMRLLKLDREAAAAAEGVPA